MAGHSQGTNHAMRLINEYIHYNGDLSEKLLLSYLIGMDVKSLLVIFHRSSEDDLFLFFILENICRE